MAEVNAEAKADFKASCESTLEGECEASCNASVDPGALVCDGSYVQVNGVDACLDAISNFQVEYEASASAEASFSSSGGCSVAPSQAAPSWPWLLGSLGFVWIARRKRK